MNSENLSLDLKFAKTTLPLDELLNTQEPHLKEARTRLLEGRGPGSDFCGWLSYARKHGKQELKCIENVLKDLGQKTTAYVVVGIGGSLLGTKAVSEALGSCFPNLQPSKSAQHPPLFWAGHHLDSEELSELLEVLEHYEPSLIVISKSGNTTEPALAFRILKDYLDKRYGAAAAAKRIVAITDGRRGILHQLAQENSYPTFTIPDNIGGRYSVFTPVGLFPLAAAGFDVHGFLEGAILAEEHACADGPISKNIPLLYAGIRNIFDQNHYKIEALCTWSPKHRGLAEWWKQLFGESDGKQGTGVFPASAQFTTDLHSLGQLFQEGARNLFATHLCVARNVRQISIPHSHTDDGFSFLEGKPLASVQEQAQQGTFLAHSEGGLPTLLWILPHANAFWIGYWMYTNFFACAVGGYARGINPFDQPGVENYKENMSALLGRGDPEKAEKIRARLAALGER